MRTRGGITGVDTGGPEAALNRRPAGRRSIFVRFRRHRLANFGVIVLVGLIVMAAFAPLIAPHDPHEIDINYPPRDKPTTTHPLGTDAISRDILSRVVYASRVSLSVGLVSVSIFVVIGTTLGAIAGYYGGWVDNLIMRAIDIVLSFPSLMLILTAVAVTGPSIYNIMIILGLLEWPQVARLVRGPLLSLREQEFALAAQAVGVGGVRMIFRHLLPNVLSPLVVAATFGVANVIVLESSLSFLGLGVQQPTASWGNMLAQAQSLTVLESKPWIWLPPGIMISVSVLSINFIGDALRDAFDPRTNIGVKTKT